MPSDIAAYQVSTEVVEGGLALRLNVQWPVPLLDMELMHSKWLAGDSSWIHYIIYEAPERKLLSYMQQLHFLFTLIQNLNRNKPSCPK